MNFKEEEKRMRQYRKQGKSEAWLKGWLRGWRSVGTKLGKGERPCS